MKRNVGGIDRALRIVLGSGLIFAGAVFLKGNGLVIGIGLFMMTLGLIGFCPLYVPLKISTRRRA